jgi:Bacterial protein of unknown function (DUF899)
MSGTTGSFKVSIESTPPIVSPEKETALMRGRDAPAAERRWIPWLTVEKVYEVEKPRGKLAYSTCSRAAGRWSSIAPSSSRTCPVGSSSLPAPSLSSIAV